MCELTDDVRVCLAHCVDWAKTLYELNDHAQCCLAQCMGGGRQLNDLSALADLAHRIGWPKLSMNSTMVVALGWRIALADPEHDSHSVNMTRLALHIASAGPSIQ